MKQGSWSILFGCHSIVHSMLVVIAWRKHYGQYPAWWQVVCILLHDIGHWGKDHLDNYEEKKSHANLGAMLAGKLFGERGYNLVFGHNEYEGQTRSELYYPDKYAQVIAPVWWLITNTWTEPKLIRKGHTRRQSAVMFKEAMTENMKNDFQEQGHHIYLRQKEESRNAESGDNVRR